MSGRVAQNQRRIGAAGHHIREAGADQKIVHVYNPFTAVLAEGIGSDVGQRRGVAAVTLVVELSLLGFTQTVLEAEPST